MKKLIERALLPTPEFWKRVQKFSVIVAGLGGYLSNPVGLPDGFTLPLSISNLGGYLIFAGTAVAVASQLATKTE
jgi:hypothetical protein